MECVNNEYRKTENELDGQKRRTFSEQINLDSLYLLKKEQNMTDIHVNKKKINNA